MLRKSIAAMAALVSVAAWAQGPATAPATQPATQPDAGPIAALIAQLGSPKFQLRKQAQKELIALGLPAEPALEDAAAHSTSAEIRSRAQAAADKIEESRPDAPTYVSIDANKEDPGKLLQAMAEQAGTPIVGQFEGMWRQGQQGYTPVTLQMRRVPLLVALEKFCKLTHTRPNTNFGGERMLQIIQGDSGPWDQENHMAVIANSIVHSRQLDLGSPNNENRQDSIDISFLFDPRWPIAGFSQVKVSKAVDENGLSLAWTAPQGQDIDDDIPTYEQEMSSQLGAETQLPLSFPAHVGKKLAHFEGSITVRLITKSAAIEVPDLAKAVGGAGVTAGDRKLEVISFDANGQEILRVRVSNLKTPGMIARAMGSRPEQQVNLFSEFRTATITDANGKQVSFSPGGSWSDNSADIQCRVYNRMGQNAFKPPYSLHWNVIVTSKDVAVPFKFTNLLLPSP